MEKYIVCCFVSFIAGAIYARLKGSSKRFNFKAAESIAERLLKSAKDGSETLKKEFETIKQEPIKRRIVVDKIGYNRHVDATMNIWIAIVLYMAHSYALYAYSPSLFHTVVGECFGYESYHYEKFCAIDNILNFSPLLYSDNGFPRERTISHNGFTDYATEEYYELVYQMIIHGKI